jgi:hypothetical protein
VTRLKLLFLCGWIVAIGLGAKLYVGESATEEVSLPRTPRVIESHAAPAQYHSLSPTRPVSSADKPATDLGLRTGAPAGEPLPPKAEEPSDEEIEARLDANFEGDGPATRESAALAKTIERAFTRPDIDGTRVKSIDCRARRCRTEIEFDSVHYDRQAFKKIFLESQELNVAVTVAKRETLPNGHVLAFVHTYPPGDMPYE